MKKSTTNGKPDNRKIASCVQRGFRDPKETISVLKESSPYVGRESVGFLIGCLVFPMMVTSQFSIALLLLYGGTNLKSLCSHGLCWLRYTRFCRILKV